MSLIKRKESSKLWVLYFKLIKVLQQNHQQFTVNSIINRENLVS